MVVVVVGDELIHPDSTFRKTFKSSIRVSWPVLGCTKERFDVRVVI